MAKITAIYSGGDWCDAAVNFLILPEGVDGEEEKRKYDKYALDVISRRRAGDMKITYIGFIKWLMNLGAVEPGEDLLESISDD